MAPIVDNAAPESAIHFGPQQRLFGLLNHCTGDAPVACLLLNVGVTQRIGPRRLNVKLARALRVLSVTSLRFDLSGIGDSGAAGAQEQYRTQSVADLRSAMDDIEARTGIRRFAVLGICSGAVAGYRVAQEDPRVVGLMMFDGYAFPTLTTRIVHDWRRLTTMPLGAVLSKVTNRTRRLLGLKVPESAVSIFYATRDDNSPDQHTFGDVLETLSARGVRMLIGYSGSLLAQYNHQGQFGQAFKGRAFLGKVICRYLPHIDHIPTSQHAQAEFLDMVCTWVRDEVVSA